MYQLNDLLDIMVSQDATCMYINVGSPPAFRKTGHLMLAEGPAIDEKEAERLVMSIASESHQEKIKTAGGVDFAFSFQDKARFRVSVYKNKGAYAMCLRLIPNKFKTIDELGLPPIIGELIQRPRGLILVTGPTCSGKTTTLTSMLNWLNQNKDYHIITIEDPIEFQFNHSKSIVSQREVGTDVPSFSEALVKALRQDPDVIMVGEMRDPKTMEAALMASETGHLVFATLHTTGAADTMDRIMNAFPAESRAQVRIQLASAVIGVISQTLCQRVDGGLVPAFEIMVKTPSISALIREEKTFRITSEIQTGSQLGMITMDSYLLNLYNQGIISKEEVISKAHSLEIVHEALGDQIG